MSSSGPSARPPLVPAPSSVLRPKPTSKILTVQTCSRNNENHISDHFFFRNIILTLVLQPIGHVTVGAMPTTSPLAIMASVGPRWTPPRPRVSHHPPQPPPDPVRQVVSDPVQVQGHRLHRPAPMPYDGNGVPLHYYPPVMKCNC